MQAIPESQPQQTQPERQSERQVWISFLKRLLIYVLIVLVGTTIVHFLFVDSVLQAVSDAIPEAQGIAQILNALVQRARDALRDAGIMGMLASNVGTVLGGVVNLLLLAAITHLLMVILLRGEGTIPRQVSGLLAIYNRWLPIQYVLLAIAALFAWSALPQSLCLFAPAVIVALYVGAKATTKIGEAYHKSARQGCVAYVGAIILFSIVTGGLFAVLLNALIFALDYRF